MALPGDQGSAADGIWRGLRLSKVVAERAEEFSSSGDGIENRYKRYVFRGGRGINLIRLRSQLPTIAAKLLRVTIFPPLSLK